MPPEQTHDELRWQQEISRSCMNIAGVILIALDVQKRVKMINKKGCEILGREEADIVGKVWTDHFVPQRERQTTEAAFSDLLQEGHHADEHVNAVIDGNGNERQIHWRNMLLRDSCGRIMGTLSSGEDITESRKSEEQLKASEERFRELAELLPQTVFETDKEGRLTFVNRQAYVMFGYTPADFERGLWAMDMLAMPDREVAAARFAAIMAGAPATNDDYLALRKDGSTFPVTAYNSVIRTGDAITGLRGLIVDISGRVRAQQERLALEERLRKAAKMEAVGRLAGGIAHDFNNLLLPIIGFADLALTQLGKEHPLHEDIMQIRRAGERAASLTRQLLAFSRRESLQPALLDINAVVREMEIMLRRLIREDVNLQVRLDRRPCIILGDAGEMEQVVMNLALNARDAMPDGGELIIRTESVMLAEKEICQNTELPPGPYVLLTVSDTGQGMSSEVIERIFDPFFTTKPSGKGTGLGLSTAYSIIQRSGGGIKVQSAPGKGSAFSIYLPVPDAEAPQAAAKERPPVVFRKKGIILLIEDEEMVRELIKRLLAKWGHEALVASNAEEAVALARAYEGEIDLVLSDLILPDLDGRAAVERIRKDRPGVRVLYMSGYAGDTLIRDGGAAPEEKRILTKPFTEAELGARIRQILQE